MGCVRTYDFIDDTFVGVEIEGKTRVAVCDMSIQGDGRGMEDRLFFDKNAGSPLGCLGANAALQKWSAQRLAGARATDHGELEIALVGVVAARMARHLPGGLDRAAQSTHTNTHKHPIRDPRARCIRCRAPCPRSSQGKSSPSSSGVS